MEIKCQSGQAQELRKKRLAWPKSTAQRQGPRKRRTKRDDEIKAARSKREGDEEGRSAGPAAELGATSDFTGATFSDPCPASNAGAKPLPIPTA